MNKILMFALLSLLPIHSYALDLDKKKHILASVLTFGTAYVITEDIKISLIFGLGVGLAKEIYDSTRTRGTGFDTHDLAADAVGAGLGLGFTWVKRF